MRRLIALGLTVMLVGACAPAPVPGPTQPTTSATTSAVAGRPVTFATADQITLTGRVYGSGDTAVVLSNMGDNDPGPWEAFAPLLAARGYTVLTYSFRYPLDTNSFTATMARDTVTDLTAAIAYVRAHGTRRVVLVGASLGGITTGAVAASAGAVAVVIISAEQNLVGYGLAVTAHQLAAMTAPKLFIASEADQNTPFADTQAFFHNAPPPKEFHTFTGDVHGVRIFATDHGDELRALLIAFVTAHAPAPS